MQTWFEWLRQNQGISTFSSTVMFEYDYSEYVGSNNLQNGVQAKDRS
jgi:hypothetical protein